jgi:hypothetical protein
MMDSLEKDIETKINALYNSTKK